MNKHKIVQHRGRELLLGLGVVRLCRSPLPSPVFWAEQSARLEGGVVAYLGESVILFYFLLCFN